MTIESETHAYNNVVRSIAIDGLCAFYHHSVAIPRTKEELGTIWCNIHASFANGEIEPDDLTAIDVYFGGMVYDDIYSSDAVAIREHLGIPNFVANDCLKLFFGPGDMRDTLVRDVKK